MGDRFSGDVAAQVVAADTGRSIDDVVDLLDDLTPTDTAGEGWLVETDGSIAQRDQSGGVRHRWFYRFSSDLVGGYLRNRPLGNDPTADRDQRDRYLNRVLDAFVDTHHRDVGLAAQIAATARRAGRPEVAARFEHIAAAVTRAHALPHEAIALLAMADLETPDPQRRNDLLDTCQTLIDFGLLTLAVRCGQAAKTLAANIPDDPRGLALAHYWTGVAHQRRGDPTTACIDLETATRHFRAAHDADGDDPTPTHRRELAIGLGEWGWAVRVAGNAADALDLLEESVGLRRGLVDEDPTPTHRRDLAIGLRDWGGAVRAAGNAADAVAPLEESVTLNRGLVGEDPTPTHRRGLAVGLRQWGGALRVAGNAADAVSLLEEAVGLNRGLVGEDPTPTHRRDLAIGLHDWGGAVREAGNAADAVAPLEEAVTLFRGLVDDDPTPTHRRDLDAAQAELERVESEAR